MKALVLKSKGHLPALTEVPVPTTSNNEIVLDLKYSALNHRDLWISKDKYPNIKEGVILGSDGMGYVGNKRYIINPGLKWGKNERVQSKYFEVLGLPGNGTFAEQISIDQKYIHKIPNHLSDQEAAALPLGGVTAYRVLIKRCQLLEKENVLINGVGGGVAHFALLFALAAGANAYVTSGTDSKIEKALHLGARSGVNYHKSNYQKSLKELCPNGFDVIIDSAAGEQFKHLVKLCSPGGRIGIYGGSLGKISEINPQILFWRQISILGSTMGSEKDFQEMLNFVEQKKLHPHIDTIIPFTEYQKGFERMDNADQFGKIVFDHSA